MNKQVQIYSLDDKAFYTAEENVLNKELMRARSEKTIIEEFTFFDFVSTEIEFKHKFENIDDYRTRKYDLDNSKWVKKDIKKFMKDNRLARKSPELKKLLKDNEAYKEKRSKIQGINKDLNKIIKTNKTLSRDVNSKLLKPWNKISLFESDMSRTLDFKPNELAKELLIVRVYRYDIMDQIINNGFDLHIRKQRRNNNKIKLTRQLEGLRFPYTYKLNCPKEHYETLTSSAGQIRTKKIVFIKESTKHEFTNTFMCGLTIEDINNSEEHGMNINKFLSYLALINGATDVIEEFNIDEAIVIEDFETEVKGTVDFIDKKLTSETKEVKNKENKKMEEVTEEYWELADEPVRKEDMPISIMHSDGCGWVLPSKSSKNFMLRLPWMKGLLTPVNYLYYCKKFNDNNYKITDIYGKEWDLKEDGIQYVFSRSQFKMWKYYKDWDDYKKKFKDNNCHANYCNEEPDLFEKKRFNYQMFQTLSDIKPEEIDELIIPTVELLKSAYTDRNTMLELLGASESNKKKTYMQQALEIYPELINDKHVKEDLSDIINAKRKEAKYGKIQLDCTYTFLIPDVFAWMQHSISGNKTPEGLLENNQVFCKLYKDEKELLVERSPHLFLEHCVRDNEVNKKKGVWFCTDGIYTSSHDLISKILQNDYDGDRALVVASEKLCTIAKRNMEGIVPLYYVMGKAKPSLITNENIYQSLKTAFKYGNIGVYSNKLTKLWNQEGKKDFSLMKILCALNNFSIDAAKTLEMPRASLANIEKINAIDKLPMPYFFQFAKDKDPSKLAPINKSAVNQLCIKIEAIKIPTTGEGKNKKYDFSRIGFFKRAMLMNNPKISIRQDIADKYDEINKIKDTYFIKAKSQGKEKGEISTAVYNQIKRDLYDPFRSDANIIEFVDIIIKHIYTKHRTCKKSFLFNCFGSVIVENLKENIKKPLNNGYIICSAPGCGKRVKKQSNSQKMCKKCSDEKRKKGDRERKPIKSERELVKI